MRNQSAVTRTESLRSLRACGGQLQDYRLLAFHQVRQEHHIAIRKFQRVVMNGGAVYIDLPEDRGFVGDDILAPRPQTGALNLVRK
jgi:hypothetical protein